MEVDAARLGGDEMRRSEGSQRGRPVAAACVLLLLAGVAVGVWALTRPAPVAERLADARPDAIAAASRFATSVNTYDVRKLDDYHDRVAPLLTTEFATQFESATDSLLAAYAKTELASTGKVRQAAVEGIDADSAEVLVAVDAETVPAGLLTNPPRLRWQVSLVKQEDRWLVDDFRAVDVTTAPEQGADE